MQAELDLGRPGARKLVGAFDGGAITSNGGVALLAGADGKLRLAGRLAACFTDRHMAEAIKHTLPDLRFDPARRASKIGRDRHHKLDHDGAAIERLFVDLFLEAHQRATDAHCHRARRH